MKHSVEVLITRLDPGLPLPNYAKGGDAGADIVTRVDVTLAPGSALLFQPASQLLFLMVMQPLCIHVLALQSNME